MSNKIQHHGTGMKKLIYALFIMGCSASTQNGNLGSGLPAMETDIDKSGTITERYDLSGDQKADLWKIYKTVKADEDGKSKRLLIQKNMDVNWDGKIDVKQYYDASGQLSREEMDLDFDGKFDGVAIYQDGKLIKREQDLSFDGRPDVIKYYEDNMLTHKERDSNKDGRMDTWEYFEKGKIVRIGRDKDGDGKPEVYDDTPEPEPELPEQPKSEDSDDSEA